MKQLNKTTKQKEIKQVILLNNNRILLKTHDNIMFISSKYFKNYFIALPHQIVDGLWEKKSNGYIFRIK